MKTMQMIVIDETKSIFINSFNNDTGELVFRTSLEPRQLHKETVVIDKDMVYTNLYHFHIRFLQKFIHETHEQTRTTSD